MSGTWHPPAHAWAASNVGCFPSAQSSADRSALDHPSALDASEKAT